MSEFPYLSFILWAWIFSEFYLTWINYKGRFRYKLMEGNRLWRWVQSKVGVWSLLISSMYAFGVVFFLTFLLEFVFKISMEIAIASVVSLFLGLRIMNIYSDKHSVESFEKHCSQCEHNKECNDFLDRNCQVRFLKHRVKMAVQLEENAKD